MKEPVDFLLCNMPPATMRGPALGPAILMSTVRKQGFKAQYYDLNLQLYQTLKHVDGIEEIFFWGGVFDNEAEYQRYFADHFESFMDQWIEKIIETQPRWLGLSMLTFHCEFFLRDFLKKLKTRNPSLKVVIGGGFVDQTDKFRNEYLSEGLVDAYIAGEGEEAILALLKGDLDFPGINGTPQKATFNLQNQVIPDYSDIDPHEYGFTAIEDTKRTPCVFIEGSRGCIQKCTFCTVPFLDKKYRDRDNQSILDEMVEIKKRHGIFRFQFTDSLINASRFRLEEFCELAAKYNEAHPEFGDALRITGNYIIRPKEMVPEKYFDLYSRAGLVVLTYGIESGSDKVRRHMKKRFSNEDVIHHVHHASRVKIQSILLFIVGYPTETEEDFQQTLQLLRDVAPYREFLSLRVNWKTVIRGLKNYLNAHFDDMGLTEVGGVHWMSEHVDPAISYDRYQRFIQEAEKCGLDFRVKLDHGSITSEIADFQKVEESLGEKPLAH